MSATAVLSVTFSLSSLVGPAPPALTVTARNDSGQSVPFMRFESDGCFTHFSLAAELTLPDGSELAAELPCAVRSWPGVAGTLEAGGTVSRTLKLEALFPKVKWKTGHYGLSVRWQPYALKEYFDGGYAQLAKESSGGFQELIIAPLLGTARLRRGVDAQLPGGAVLRFNAHGHKEVMQGGPSSPLIIHGRFKKPGQRAWADFDVSVHPDSSPFFTLDDGWTFELRKYEYDVSMELGYYGRVPPPRDD